MWTNMLFGLTGLNEFTSLLIESSTVRWTFDLLRFTRMAHVYTTLLWCYFIKHPLGSSSGYLHLELSSCSQGFQKVKQCFSFQVFHKNFDIAIAFLCFMTWMSQSKCFLFKLFITLHLASFSRINSYKQCIARKLKSSGAKHKSFTSCASLWNY